MKLLAVLAIWAALTSGRADMGTTRAAFGTIDGAFVLRDCATGEETVAGKQADEAFGPCSTFKIWNSLIGLEEGLLADPDTPFWTWDGEERGWAAWNRDQTWRSAFQGSCVPAFQELARRIGAPVMQAWLDKFDYGNRDMAGRPDAFWLPRSGQDTILITPRQQARLICRMVEGDLPVKAGSVARLTEVMKLETTAHGTLYGKTGSGKRASPGGPDSEADFDTGWFVGFVESGGRRYAFACLVLGPGSGGKEARGVAEAVLAARGLL